jgi:hypothetical protein
MSRPLAISILLLLARISFFILQSLMQQTHRAEAGVLGVLDPAGLYQEPASDGEGLAAGGEDG